MTVYIFQLVLITALCFLGNYCVRGEKRRAQVQYDILILAFVILGIVMCFRSSQVGSDTSAYCHIYENITLTNSFMQALDTSALSAPIYVLGSFLLSRVFTGDQAIIIASSFIICYVMYKTIRYSSKFYLYSMLLFVLLTLYYQAFNGARQMLSVVIVLYAYFFLVDNLKSVKGWMLFLVAIGIHNTAIFFLIAILGVWLANRSKNNMKLLIKTAVLSGGFVLLMEAGITLITLMFPRYLMYVNGMNPESILVDTGGGRIAMLYIFELFIICIYLLFISKKSSICTDGHIKKMLPALVFCCISGIVFSGNTLIQRLLWYYEALFIIAIPNMLTVLNPKNRFIAWMMIIFVFMLYAVWFLAENKGNLVPYAFF